MTDELAIDYERLVRAGFVALESRCYIRVTGDDRLAFLHNFCTNEIKQMAPGQACEAFVLNTKGKILGFLHVLALENELLLTGHGPQAETVIGHLDMYLIREDCELIDATQALGSIFVTGNEAVERLSQKIVLPEQNAVCQSSLGCANVTIANIEIAGFGFLISFEPADRDEVISELGKSGLDLCSAEALEILRIENQTPWFGIDVTDANLPQELARDEKAINFNKGCYLGQETVARIDARGRVNLILSGLKFEGVVPNPGDEIFVDEKSAAKITSVVHSIRENAALGLGYVRRQFSESGTRIGDAIVLEKRS